MTRRPVAGWLLPAIVVGLLVSGCVGQARAAGTMRASGDVVADSQTGRAQVELDQDLRRELDLDAGARRGYRGQPAPIVSEDSGPAFVCQVMDLSAVGADD